SWPSTWSAKRRAGRPTKLGKGSLPCCAVAATVDRANAEARRPADDRYVLAGGLLSTQGGGRQRARGASTKFIGEESIRRSGARLARTGRTDGMDGPAEVHPPRRVIFAKKVPRPPAVG